VEIFDILGAAFPPRVAIEVKFCTAKRTHVPVGPAKFDVNRCNESPLRGEKPDFWPMSNTSSLPLHGILPVTRTLGTPNRSCNSIHVTKLLAMAGGVLSAL